MRTELFEDEWKRHGWLICLLEDLMAQLCSVQWMRRLLQLILNALSGACRVRMCIHVCGRSGHWWLRAGRSVCMGWTCTGWKWRPQRHHSQISKGHKAEKVRGKQCGRGGLDLWDRHCALKPPHPSYRRVFICIVTQDISGEAIMTCHLSTLSQFFNHQVQETLQCRGDPGFYPG